MGTLKKIKGWVSGGRFMCTIRSSTKNLIEVKTTYGSLSIPVSRKHFDRLMEEAEGREVTITVDFGVV